MAPHRRSKSRAARPGDYPGWAWGLFGLALGLSVAAAVWFSDRRSAPAPAMAREPASMESALDDNGETAAAAAIEPDAAGEEPKKSRFDFYEMLPAFEVEVTEEEASPAPGAPEPSAVVEPGVYVLQAGSFTR